MYNELLYYQINTVFLHKYAENEHRVDFYPEK